MVRPKRFEPRHLASEFCVIPMTAWVATLIAMKGYSLTDEKIKEIQAVYVCRRDAVANAVGS